MDGLLESARRGPKEHDLSVLAGNVHHKKNNKNYCGQVCIFSLSVKEIVTFCREDRNNNALCILLLFLDVNSLKLFLLSLSFCLFLPLCLQCRATSFMSH